MYKHTKRLLTCSLAVSLIASGSFSALADEKDETVDAGLSARVETYIADGSTEDPVSDLTKGAASVKDEEKKWEVVPGIGPKPSLVAVEERLKGEEKAKQLAPAEYPQFKNRAVATVDVDLNIRAEADIESDIIGTMSSGDICMVYESKDGWTHIASGCCDGYVMTEYLAFGDDAGRWAKENDVPMLATVKAESLKVREKGDYTSDCLTMIPLDESYEVLDIVGEWVHLAVDDDIQGYVNSKYVELSYNCGRALSVEEQELREAARAAEEAAASERYYDPNENTDNNNNTDNNDNTYNDNNTSDNTNNDNDTTYNDNNNDNNNDNTDNSNQETYEAPSQETYNEPVQETYEEPVQETYEEPSQETYEEPAEEPTYNVPSGSGGEDVANYALQFVGNPYVWGGTSLTNGADCSGFVLSVYANWGIYLPHDAELQANYGTPVSFNELAPGDLLFYPSGGYAIGHVAIYIGGGMVVHASSPSTGIKTSVYNYRTPCAAVRLLP